MEVRDDRGAGLRRAARGRAGFVGAALGLYALAALTAAWPALDAARSRFLAGGAPGHGEAAAGDHLQTLYHLWLVGHQLAHGRAPWLDPYSFHPEGGTVWNPPGWPFGLVFWPLGAAFGPVVGWNVFVLLTYVGAGGFACLWLRELGLPRGAALAGGLAFALAPYRVNQSVGHLLGPISLLLPLALYGIERARRGSAWWLVLAGAALASIPLSGQVHLALGAIPLFVAYAAVRLRGRVALGAAAACVAAAVGAGLLIQRGVIAGSTGAGGRSLAEVDVYSAEWPDFVARHERHGPESFVFLGWLTPLLAVAGLVLLLRARRYPLAALLGLAALVPILLSLGTNLPLYAPLWHALPPLRYPRVPERLMPIADLALAALVAFFVARVSRRAVVAVAVLVLLVVDLHVRAYGRSVADPANAAYAAVRGPGRLLELPVFLPDLHFGSVYLYYDLQAQRERPFGYSTTAPSSAERLARRLAPLNCGDWSGGAPAELRRLGIRAVLLHFGLFEQAPGAPPESAYFAWRGLLTHGWGVTGTGGRIWTFQRGAASLLHALTPPRRDLVYCQGWYAPGTIHPGRPMASEHAPLWVRGSGRAHLRVYADSPLPARFTVDERPVRSLVVPRRPVDVTLPLPRPGWHLVTVDVPRLLPTPKKKVGIRLVSVRVAGR